MRAEIEEWLDNADFPVILLAGLDDAIVGVASTNDGEVLAYSVPKIIDIRVAEGMTYDEAVDFTSFNTLNVYYGEGSPVFLSLTE